MRREIDDAIAVLITLRRTNSREDVSVRGLAQLAIRGLDVLRNFDHRLAAIKIFNDDVDAFRETWQGSTMARRMRKLRTLMTMCQEATRLHIFAMRVVTADQPADSVGLVVRAAGSG